VLNPNKTEVGTLMTTKKTKKTASKTGSVSDRARQLILEGQTDEQVFIALSLDETQKHYPPRYRAQLVRDGKLSKTEAAAHRLQPISEHGCELEATYSPIFTQHLIARTSHTAVRLEMTMAVEAELDDSSMLELQRRVEKVVVHRTCRGCTTNDDQDVVEQ
jgi:hypothetical protein